MKHLKRESIQRIEINYNPLCKIKAEVQTNCIGRITKRGWKEYRRGCDIWYDKLPVNCFLGMNGDVKMHPQIEISYGDSGFILISMKREKIKKVYNQLLELLNGSGDYIPVYAEYFGLEEN